MLSRVGVRNFSDNRRRRSYTSSLTLGDLDTIEKNVQFNLVSLIHAVVLDLLMIMLSDECYGSINVDEVLCSHTAYHTVDDYFIEMERFSL